jgi:hypothetical protein
VCSVMWNFRLLGVTRQNLTKSPLRSLLIVSSNTSTMSAGADERQPLIAAATSRGEQGLSLTKKRLLVVTVFVTGFLSSLDLTSEPFGPNND